MGGYLTEKKNSVGQEYEEIQLLLEEAGVTDGSAEEWADEVRNYAYANLEWAFDSKFVTNVEKQIFKSGIPWEKKMYELLESNTLESTGYCGGTAYALSVIYNMFNYDSGTLDLAVFDENGNVIGSHVVTLVKIDNKWIVEDPTFNLTYKEHGEHISIQDLIRKVKDGEINEIVASEGEERWRKGLFADTIYEGDYVLLQPVKFSLFEEGYFSYVDMKPEMWSVFNELYEYFENDEYEKNVLSIFTYPYNVYWPCNNEMNIIEQKQFTLQLLNL